MLLNVIEMEWMMNENRKRTMSTMMTDEDLREIIPKF